MRTKKSHEDKGLKKNSAAESSLPEAENITPQLPTKCGDKAIATRERIDIDPTLLVAAPWNPRANITPDSVADLASSIASVGMIEPIVVMRSGSVGDDKYIIIAGHRRAKAAIVAGLQSVPCDVMNDVDEAKARRMTFIENLQRKDVDPLLEAELVANLITDGMTKTEIAAEIGRGENWVARRMNLQKLSSGWREALSSGVKITTDCLEHIAAYPEKIQDELVYLSRERQNSLRWSDIRYSFVSRSCDLIAAIFDRKKCEHCLSNTGCSMSLFEDISISADGKFGRCLNPSCYNKKRDKHIDDTISAAKSDGVKVIKDDPRYMNGVKTSDKKTKICNTLYVWKDCAGTRNILWASAKKNAKQSSADDEAAKQKKEKLARQKIISDFASWCSENDRLEGEIQQYIMNRFYHLNFNDIVLVLPFLFLHAFEGVGSYHCHLPGTNSSPDDSARAALFGDLKTLSITKIIHKITKEIIATLNTKIDNWTAFYNAKLILALLSEEARASLSPDIVAAISADSADEADEIKPQIDWDADDEAAPSDTAAESSTESTPEA